MIRRHDLPPAWDGETVRWDTWERIWTTAEFHFKPTPCERCGNTDTQARNCGSVEERFSRNRTAWVTRLFAYRCPGCRLDTVWDMRTDQMWLLDETDYGNAGSWVTQEVLF